MTYLELGLQEIGLLDKVSQKCQEAGISLAECLHRLVDTGSTAPSAQKITPSTDFPVFFDECMNKAMTDPEWRCQQKEALSQDEPGFEFTMEETRELCQD